MQMRPELCEPVVSNQASKGLETPPWMSQTQLFGDHIEQDVKQFKMTLHSA